MASSLHIGDAIPDHHPAITAIYNHYINHDICTFELTPLSQQTMAARITERQTDYGFLCARLGQEVAGFAYYGTFRPRAAYHHVVETSIYIHPQACHQGFGRLLYTAAIDHARTRGYREAIAVIALPNPASIALHQNLGFTHQGTLPRSGHKFNRYLDTAWYQLSL